MTRFNRALWLSAAASVVFAFGCGGNETPDGGSGSCTTDATCGTGKACHPVLKTCVSSCSGSSDCPSSEKTCAKINNSAASFCTCSTDQLCAAATTGNICNSATRQCTAKCTASSCPSGFTCDTASGNCTGGGATDGGTDGGSGDAGVACSLNNPQPDTCGYANACFDTMVCDSLEDRRCANITAAIAASRFTAWTSTSTGAMIYASTELTGETAGCSGATDVPFTTTLYAYAGVGATFPTNITAWPGFKYFTSSGMAIDIPGNLVGNVTFPYAGFVLSNSNKNAAITLTLCAPQGTTSLTAGFAFTGGKAYCANLTR